MDQIAATVTPDWTSQSRNNHIDPDVVLNVPVSEGSTACASAAIENRNPSHLVHSCERYSRWHEIRQYVDGRQRGGRP